MSFQIDEQQEIRFRFSTVIAVVVLLAAGVLAWWWHVEEPRELYTLTGQQAIAIKVINGGEAGIDREAVRAADRMVVWSVRGSDESEYRLYRGDREVGRFRR